MTPLEEQVEKLARRWEKEADEGELLDEVAYALEGAADELRALLPLEVTDEMVEAGAKALGEWGGRAMPGTPLNRELSRACLSAALTQPQTERCPEDCDGFGRLIGDSDGPCPACSGLESDGGGAATAAGVADADLVKWTIDEMREALEHIARHPQECPHAKKGFEQQAKCSLCMAATARNALDRIEEANEIQLPSGGGSGTETETVEDEKGACAPDRKEAEPTRWWYRDQWWVRKELSWDIGTFTVVYCPERDKVFCTGSFESHTRKYWILRSARTFECSDGVTRIESGEVLPPKDGQWFAQGGVPKKAHRFYEPSFSYPILVPVEDTEPATDGEK